MKKTALVLGSFACFLICMLLCYPEVLLQAAANSLQLWLTKVFPSLFPFLAACNLLLQIGVAEQAGARLRPLMQPLFGVSGAAAFPFFLGMLSGYPAGARMTAQLYEKKLLSLPEAQHTLLFSNLPGPLFLIGTVGAGFFGMPAAGLLLLLSVLSGALLLGVLLRPAKSKSASLPLSPAPLPNCTATQALSVAVGDALETILAIGGYLILFAVFGAALQQAGLFSLLSRLLFFLPLSPQALEGLGNGLMEMTNGAFLLSHAPDPLRLRLALTALLVCFGGCSILGQTFGVLVGLPLSRKKYLREKCLHAALSGCIAYAAYPAFFRHAQKAVPVLSFCTDTAFSLSLLWLLPSLFFLLAWGMTLRRIGKRRLISRSAAPEYSLPVHSRSGRNNHRS